MVACLALIQPPPSSRLREIARVILRCVMYSQPESATDDMSQFLRQMFHNLECQPQLHLDETMSPPPVKLLVQIANQPLDSTAGLSLIDSTEKKG